MQYSLRTLVVVSLVAGALLWLQLRPYGPVAVMDAGDLGMIFGYKVEAFGWPSHAVATCEPFAVSDKALERHPPGKIRLADGQTLEIDQWLFDFERSRINWVSFAIDATTCLVILTFAAALTGRLFKRIALKPRSAKLCSVVNRP